MPDTKKIPSDDQLQAMITAGTSANAGAGLDVFNQVAGLLPKQQLVSTAQARYSTGGNGTA